MTATAPRHPARAFTARAGAAAFGRAARAVAWYMGELMGDSAYRVYLEHHRATHAADDAPMTEREYWRCRMDEQDQNPGARCC